MMSRTMPVVTVSIIPRSSSWRVGREHDVFLDHHVEAVARPHLDGGLDVEVLLERLTHHVAEGRGHVVDAGLAEGERDVADAGVAAVQQQLRKEVTQLKATQDQLTPERDQAKTQLAVAQQEVIGLTKRIEELQETTSVTGSVSPPAPASKPPRTPAKAKGKGR